MTHDWKEVDIEDEEQLKCNLSNEGYSTVTAKGAQVYHCTNGSELDLGALRIILGSSPVVPKVQQEPSNKGSESEQTAVATELNQEITDLAEKYDSNTKKRTEQGAVDKRVEELRWELEEEKRRAREEADGLKKRIAEMQLEERIRKETCQELEEQKRRAGEEADRLRRCIAEMQLEERIRKETCQELEEQKRRAREEADMFKKQIAEMQSKEEIARKATERRAQEEADGLRKYIAEMQSKLEEERHTSGKASATYLNSRHVPSHPI